MTWGLGMIPIGFVIWCIRKRNQSGIMPFLLWLYLICLLLGGLNGMRCRMLSPLQKYMDACYEENGQEEVLCEMEGRVERAEMQKGKWIFLIRANRIRNERFQYQSPCRVKLYSKEGDIKIGDRIACELTLKRLPIPTNPGEFNSRQYYLARGIEFTGYADTVRVLDEGRYTGKQWLWKLRMQTQKVFQMHMSEEYASVMNAMLLGDSGNLDPEIKQLYQRNGIAHILAISGVKTLKLDIPLVPETCINWAFVSLHIAIIYILKLCLNGEIIPRCRFPCSRGYRKKYINWQKKQSFSVSQSYRKS